MNVYVVNISVAMPALELKHVIITDDVHVNCLRGCKAVHDTNSVKLLYCI